VNQIIISDVLLASVYTVLNIYIGSLIIREVCEADPDTICGPFLEFDRFQQSTIDNLHTSKYITFEWEETVDTQIEDHDDCYTSDSNYTRVGSPVQIDGDKKWYILAMTLLGVLSFIALFVGIYIIAVCFVCKKRRSEKEIIYDPGNLLWILNKKKSSFFIFLIN